MQAVLFAVRPEWCRKIATREKTIEVRKTAPKLPAPYKGFLYCTQPHPKRRKDVFYPFFETVKKMTIPPEGLMVTAYPGNGKVWAEFICNSADPHDLPYPAYQREVDPMLLKGSCLTYTELHNYVGSGNRFYGLHISELTIYDKPRELSDFRRWCPNDLYCESCAMFSMNAETCGNSALVLNRPPQSWCYVEEMP